MSIFHIKSSLARKPLIFMQSSFNKMSFKFNFTYRMTWTRYSTFILCPKNHMKVVNLPIFTAPVVLQVTDKNDTFVFVNFWAQCASVLKISCSHHQEEVMRIPKHTLQSIFQWFLVKLWRFENLL